MILKNWYLRILNRFFPERRLKESYKYSINYARGYIYTTEFRRHKYLPTYYFYEHRLRWVSDDYEEDTNVYKRVFE